MFRTLWQWVVDNIYDPIADNFRTQEEIDARLDTKMGEWGVVTDDPADLSGFDSHRSKSVFLSPDDAIQWVKEGGIPSSCVIFFKLPDWNEYGDTGYAVYVKEHSE